MVVFPIAVIVFFTTVLGEGQPTDMPVGIVDLDNTTTTRALIRQLDGFQTSKVVGYYNSMQEARQAIQRNKIYAYLYIPEGTTRELLASRRPKISFYYSYTSLTSGSLLYRDLKTSVRWVLLQWERKPCRPRDLRQSRPWRCFNPLPSTFTQ